MASTTEETPSKRSSSQGSSAKRRYYRVRPGASSPTRSKLWPYLRLTTSLSTILVGNMWMPPISKATLILWPSTQTPTATGKSNRSGITPMPSRYLRVSRPSTMMIWRSSRCEATWTGFKAWTNSTRWQATICPISSTLPRCRIRWITTIRRLKDRSLLYLRFKFKIILKIRVVILNWKIKVLGFHKIHLNFKFLKEISRGQNWKNKMSLSKGCSWTSRALRSLKSCHLPGLVSSR